MCTAQIAGTDRMSQETIKATIRQVGKTTLREDDDLPDISIVLAMVLEFDSAEDLRQAMKEGTVAIDW